MVAKLDRAATAFGMAISAFHKLMTNNTSGFGTNIMIGDQKLDTVNKFKYLGAIVTDEGSKPEILSRIAMTITSVARVKTVWKDRNISVSSKIRLMHSLVVSVFLYACGSRKEDTSY